MSQTTLVGSIRPSWADRKAAVLSLMLLAEHQMSLFATHGIYRPAELEHLSLKTLEIARKLSLVNANCFKTNAEAIDLRSTDGRLGIQITLKVYKGKAEKTVAAFRKKSIPGGSLAGMQELWILGLRPATSGAINYAASMNDVIVGSLENQLELDNLDDADLESLQDHLYTVTGTQQGVKPSLTESLRRFTDFLDRPAISDPAGAAYENWSDCIAALDSATYLARSGTWAELNKPAKENWTIPFADLPKAVQEGLRPILQQIITLKNTVKTINPQCLSLQGQPASLIDLQRKVLMVHINEFCTSFGLKPPFA